MRVRVCARARTRSQVFVVLGCVCGRAVGFLFLGGVALSLSLSLSLSLARSLALALRLEGGVAGHSVAVADVGVPAGRDWSNIGQIGAACAVTHFGGGGEDGRPGHRNHQCIRLIREGGEGRGRGEKGGGELVVVVGGVSTRTDRRNQRGTRYHDHVVTAS